MVFVVFLLLGFGDCDPSPHLPAHHFLGQQPVLDLLLVVLKRHAALIPHPLLELVGIGDPALDLEAGHLFADILVHFEVQFLGLGDHQQLVDAVPQQIGFHLLEDLLGPLGLHLIVSHLGFHLAAILVHFAAGHDLVIHLGDDFLDHSGAGRASAAGAGAGPGAGVGATGSAAGTAAGAGDAGVGATGSGAAAGTDAGVGATGSAAGTAVGTDRAGLAPPARLQGPRRAQTAGLAPPARLPGLRRAQTPGLALPARLQGPRWAQTAGLTLPAQGLRQARTAAPPARASRRVSSPAA